MYKLVTTIVNGIGFIIGFLLKMIAEIFMFFFAGIGKGFKKIDLPSPPTEREKNLKDVPKINKALENIKKIKVTGEAQPANSHFEDFQRRLSKEQKSAVFFSLFSIAKIDGELSWHEKGQIEYLMKVLHITSDGSIFNKPFSLNSEIVFKILPTLNIEQKNWFIIAIHTMLSVDGEIKDVPLKYAIGICKEIGISEDDYLRTIEEANV